MKKYLATTVCIFFVTILSQAQSKVFKEVNDEVASQVKSILQDDALVGYLVFTKLEKASADSFNYKITIMDENLNDIGKITFKEQYLYLKAVSFNQDVLNIGYLKIAKKVKSGGNNKKSDGKFDFIVFNQFVSLEGKILKTHEAKVAIKERSLTFIDTKYAENNEMASDGLKHNIQIKSIPQKGFSMFYGDDKSNTITVFSAKGEQVWKKNNIKDADGGFILNTSKDYVYLLSKNYLVNTPEGGYEIQTFGIADSSSLDKIELKDMKGNYLKILSFQNDPITGNPYIAGNIINLKFSDRFSKSRYIAKGCYSGVFTINCNGPKKKDFKETYTYWNDGSLKPGISETGKLVDQELFVKYLEAIKDFNGNTYFIGSSFVRKTKYGALASCILLSPIILPSIYIAGFGFIKVRTQDVIVLKQDNSGKVSVDNTLKCNYSKYVPSSMSFNFDATRKFYEAKNSEAKSNYIIIDDQKDIFIYNINNKKVVRTISHKDGNSTTNIYPAKDGYIMVAEYNRKEKYSRFSIEAL